MPRTTAKDFFLHLGAMVALYSGTIALLNLLFTVIDVAFPTVARSYFGSTSISLPVATLIVVFPLFLLLSNILNKGYEIDPTKKEYAVRRWLVYITLFISGGVIAGDLITIIYFFLDGRDITTSFILKFLALLVVLGSIFGYYIDDLKNRLVGNRRNMWRAVGTILVIGSIIAGFSVIGSPRTQRLVRYDAQKIGDLQSIQWQVVNFWQQKGRIPANIDELKDPISSFYIPTDPQSGMVYEYRALEPMTFELCANFNKQSTVEERKAMSYSMPRYAMDGTNENWMHGSGRHCFVRTIDPDLYPVTPKPIR